MIATLKNLRQSMLTWLRWPHIVQKSASRSDAGRAEHFEVVVSGQLKIAIDHDGRTLVQRLAVDAAEPLHVAVHNAAGAGQASAVHAGPTLRLTLTNLWSVLALQARRVLRLRRAGLTDLPQQRTHLRPLPTKLVEPLSPGLRLQALAQEQDADLAARLRKAAVIPEMRTNRVFIQPVDVMGAWPGAGQPPGALQLARTSAWVCDFQATLRPDPPPT